MKLTFARSLAILVGVGVPLVAGGMVALRHREKPPAYLEAKTPPKKSCCCCDLPSKEAIAIALAEKKGQHTDSPMFGGTPNRNMANLLAKGIPAAWSVEEGKEKNLKWTATVGNKSYGGPVITGGKVYVGTNNANPRDPKIEGHKAVLMAFAEKDGKFLWQIVHDIPPDEIFKEAIGQGLCSTPIVEGNRIYYVTPGAEVVCASDEGNVLWKHDMMKVNKVTPFHLANCSPLIVGDLVMIITSNGVDEDGKVHHPKAPSFMALHKQSGKVVWEKAYPGANIIEGQWSNPALAVVDGKEQVLFPGGDGVIYSLEPDTGELIWKFNCHPSKKKEEERGIDNYFIATPVVVGDRMFISMGVYPEHPTRTKSSYVFCIDVTKKGDVSPKNLDAKDPANKGSALIWAFGGAFDPRPKTGRPVRFATTISTCAVVDDLVYISEESGYLHCLNAKTGERLWMDDLKSGVWGSPYYVDGKVMIGIEDGVVFVYKHGPKKEVLAEIDMGEGIHSTPVVANNVLYITTKSKVIAIQGK